MDLAGVGLDQARVDVSYATARAFDAALFLREERKVLEAQLSSLAKHREDAEVRERTGSSTHYDVLATEVRMASVKSQLIDVGAQYAKQMIELKRLTGLKGAIDPVGDIEPGPSELDPEAATAEAVASRDDLRQAVAAERQAAIGIDVARLGNRPTLSTQAQAGYRNGILTYDNADVDKLTFNWSLGLSLNVPIYDAGQAASKTGEALAKADAASAGRADRELTVKAQVLQSIEDATACHEQTANSLARLAQAQEALAIAEVQYGVGAATNLQYLDAQTELEIAQLSKLSASYREVLSGLALDQVIGKKLP
jgi:outer membrane protein TolC